MMGSCNCRSRDTFERLGNELGRALFEMEKLGAAPVCSDGKVGGNGAVKYPTTNNVSVYANYIYIYMMIYCVHNTYYIILK